MFPAGTGRRAWLPPAAVTGTWHPPRAPSAALPGPARPVAHPGVCPSPVTPRPARRAMAAFGGHALRRGARRASLAPRGRVLGAECGSGTCRRDRRGRRGGSSAFGGHHVTGHAARVACPARGHRQARGGLAAPARPRARRQVVLDAAERVRLDAAEPRDGQAGAWAGPGRALLAASISARATGRRSRRETSHASATRRARRASRPSQGLAASPRATRRKTSTSAR